MNALRAAIRIGMLEMRGNLRRFAVLVACLAIGTALIAGVSSVGASIRQAVERDAALLMGGDLELTRTDRPATPAELATLAGFGDIANVVDTNVRATSVERDAFVDLVAIGRDYPLLGHIDSPQLAADSSAFSFLVERGGLHGALLDPLMLEELGAAVGDSVQIGGTWFEVRGTLRALPDAPVRGFRLGLPALITTDALAVLGDRTSPLPGLGSVFRYKLALGGADAEAAKQAVAAALADPSWTVRTARDGLGPMVRYYDLFMRFLVIVGLASLLIGGVSVWSGISAYVTEKGVIIATLRSMGAGKARIFTHFFTQVAVLAAIGVGSGLVLGAATALVALPVVGEAVGVALPPQLHAVPLLVAAAVGLLTAFAFSFLPLQQALGISPVMLFRSKGLAAPSLRLRDVLAPTLLLPLLAAAAAFVWLATVMTGDLMLVVAFGAASVLAMALVRLSLFLVGLALTHLPQPSNRLLRHALRDMSGPSSKAPAVIVSIGLAVAMLAVVLVLQTNLRNEYLGASIFDAPSFVASDLFEDEVALLQQMQEEGGRIAQFTATPMLRGALARLNDTEARQLSPRGPEAAFLMSGEVPLTYRVTMPETSRLVAGRWWAADHLGPPLVSLHQSLRSGLGVELGDTLTFTIFGEEVSAEVASFRDYSWQGGIDFLATFSPGVLEAYPATLLGAVTAHSGEEEALELELAAALPDVRFIAIGETLKQITTALGQLSLAASLVGGLAVGNGLLVLLGSLATGRRQREADAVITKVLGARRHDVLAVAVLHYTLLALLAAVVAIPLGTGMAFILSLVLLDVEFTVNAPLLGLVGLTVVAVTGLLGATTIRKALAPRPALLLRELSAE